MGANCVHCVDDVEPKNIGVGLGFVSLADYLDNKNTFTYSISQIYIHPSYIPHKNTHNIALIRLEKTALSIFSTITLSSNLTGGVEGKAVGIVGWGQTETAQYSDNSDLVQTVEPHISNTRTNKPSWTNGKVTQDMVVAGFPTGGKSFCYGDFGGPFLGWDRLKNNSTGVLTWGERDSLLYKCSMANDPTIGLNVAHYVSWIAKTIGISRNLTGTFVGSEKILLIPSYFDDTV